jgi:hypothetical protein
VELAGGEVYVAPTERQQLAASQSREEGRRPQPAISLCLERVDERGRLLRRDDLHAGGSVRR